MNRKAMFVIRIGVSIENENDDPITVVVEPDLNRRNPEPDEGVVSQSGGLNHQTSSRSQGGNANPRAAEEGRSSAMTDTQRKALFRLAFALGDRDSALRRILDALGVEELESATKAQASRAITFLEAQRGRPARPSNGAHCD